VTCVTSNQGRKWDTGATKVTTPKAGRNGFTPPLDNRPDVPEQQRFKALACSTDGEDGPTDAAGALLDAEVLDAARQQGLDPADYLRRNDAYHFFEPLGALIKTGPTHTNVCDVRVVVVERPAT